MRHGKTGACHYLYWCDKFFSLCLPPFTSKVLLHPLQWLFPVSNIHVQALFYRNRSFCSQYECVRRKNIHKLLTTRIWLGANSSFSASVYRFASFELELHPSFSYQPVVVRNSHYSGLAPMTTRLKFEISICSQVGGHVESVQQVLHQHELVNGWRLMRPGQPYFSFPTTWFQAMVSLKTCWAHLVFSSPFLHSLVQVTEDPVVVECGGLGERCRFAPF